MGVGSCSFRILPAPIGGGTNDETNNALDNFCSGSYGARRFRLDSERVDIPLGRGRRQVRPARLRKAPVGRSVTLSNDNLAGSGSPHDQGVKPSDEQTASSSREHRRLQAACCSDSCAVSVSTSREHGHNTDADPREAGSKAMTSATKSATNCEGQRLNGGGVSRLRSAHLVAAVAELGSLEPLAAPTADSSSRNTVSFSSACTTKRFPSPRCASAIQMVRPSRSTAKTQLQLHPALLRLSAMISQYFKYVERVPPSRTAGRR